MRVRSYFSQIARCLWTLRPKGETLVGCALDSLLMDFEKTPLAFSDALVELLNLIGRRLTIYVDYGHWAGGASFQARLERVTPVYSGTELVLCFSDEAFAHLSPDRMTAYRVINTLTENYWLEFMIGDHEVLTIEREGYEDVWIRADQSSE